MKQWKNHVMALMASIGRKTYHFLSYFYGQSKSYGKPVNGVRSVMLLKGGGGAGPGVRDPMGKHFCFSFLIFWSYESLAL